MDLKELSSISVKKPGSSDDVSLLQLADDWAEYVLRLDEQLIEAGADLAGIKEFVGGLQVRDRLEEGLADVTAPALIRAADALYKACTHRDDHRVLARLDDDLPTQPWWWERIPASGPLASEFSKQARLLR